MGMANAPKAPCVDVWLSPQTITSPGRVRPKLRADDVHDPLPVRLDSVEADAKVVGVLLERLYLLARYLVLDEQAVDRRHVVVDRRDSEVRAAHGAAGQAQALKRLRRRHLVHEVQIDIKERRLAGLLAHDVRVPDLVEHRSRRMAFMRQ